MNALLTMAGDAACLAAPTGHDTTEASSAAVKSRRTRMHRTLPRRAAGGRPWAMRSTPSLIVVVGLPLVVLAQGGGWRANPDIVAREAARRPDTNYEESRVPPYTLPDLLPDGSRAIARPAGWTPRRAAILDLFRDNVYGRSPAPPEHLAFTVL